MIFTAAMLGLLLGFLRGGRLANLSHQKLEVPYLLPVSYLCEWLASTGLLARALSDNIQQDYVLMGLAVIQYVTVLIFIGLNINRPGMGLFLIGSLMNGSVIIANSGRMPIGELIYRFGTDALNRIAEAPHYMLATGTEPLVFLSDWIPFWSFGWYMVSFGDFFIAVGVLFFAADLLCRPTVFNLFKVEHPDGYVYTKERSLTREERGMLFYGLYRHNYREGQKRQKDDRPA
jgi:hypothetical protein